MGTRRCTERGSIAVWAAMVIPAFVIIVGLGVDFAGHAAAEQSARAVAAEAARAGGQYLHAGPGSRPEPNTSNARQAATAYVEASDLTGTVSLDAGVITVRVTGRYETLFLGIMGVNELPIHGRGAASVHTVVDGAER
ncbi:pilus assembly protein [Tessaracoccus rhinocerotis]|uniref:Pilus assembly protein n=1 Tax=Tessaracoccus rhinocerotis TaxID=1689449 RepID=A0A553JYE7_9ACTN|nr:pilus assembly protein TadG-related protein [Tessaracoccus rhinocerotis]TRY17467.1 pilus assembly protein [Tessaracoccus rhinocerotis]